MFNKNIEHYIFLFILLGITGAVGSKFKQYFVSNPKWSTLLNVVYSNLVV